jgi:hypothetical protein
MLAGNGGLPDWDSRDSDETFVLGQTSGSVAGCRRQEDVNHLYFAKD